MKFAFMDDSGREKHKVPRRGLGSLQAYGAVVFPEQSLKPYTASLVALREELGIPADTEFKWSPDGGPLHKKWKELHTARTRMLDAAIDLGVSATVVVCAPDLMPSWYQKNLKSEMLRYLYERITYSLGDEESGLIIADQPGGGRGDETHWLADALALDTNGTAYVKPEDKQVVLPIITTRSDHVAHLQLADLVTAATTVLVSGDDTADRYREQIQKLLMRNTHGYIGGTGLKLVPSTAHNPRALMNLAHWVFGEDTYVEPGTSSMIGSPLPHSGWLYGADDGLSTEAGTTQ